MKATLKPLSGKYYGTEIEIDFGDGGDSEAIILWDTDIMQPSIRELGKHGVTQKQWDNNELIKTEEGQIRAKEMDIVCDCHFESKLTYERAIRIINAINSQP